MQLIVLALVLFAADIALFVSVDANGELPGLSAGWTILVAAGIWIAIADHRWWPLPVPAVVLNAVMFLPALLG